MHTGSGVKASFDASISEGPVRLLPTETEMAGSVGQEQRWTNFSWALGSHRCGHSRKLSSAHKRIYPAGGYQIMLHPSPIMPIVRDLTECLQEC